MPARLLVIDQDTRYGEWLKHHLGVICPDSTIGLMQLSDFHRWSEEVGGRDCDVLMLAAAFGSSPEDPQAQGLELLRRVRDKQYFPAVIAVAEEGNELTAVRALQLGAVDYLPKRLLTPERLKTSVRLALRMIEKRVARRIANLTYTSEADAKGISAEARSVSVDIRSNTGSRANLAARAASIAAASVEGLGTASDGSNTSDAIRTAVLDGASADEASANGDRALVSSPDSQSTSGAPFNGTSSFSSSSTNIRWPGVGVESGGGRSSRRAPEGALPSGESSTNIRAASGAVQSGGGPSNRRAPESALSSAESSTNIRAAGGGVQSGGRSSAERALEGALPAGESSTNIRLPSGESSTNIRPATGPRQVTGAGTSVPAARAPGGEFMPANFIPGYTIHATIGESEKAAVYVATHDVRGENVALKVSKTLRDEAAGRQFLEREYTAIVAIRDPSVVQIFDYGVHAGYEYLVMEYLPRGDLKARMQQGLTEQEAVRYVVQIAAALRVVHRAGLLHRDLKPPNVMLRENGEVALIDFGLARALDGSTPSTRTGVLRGSPYYMSPEQALGEVLDARSDFYSLGIMFYEMLTGRKPYTGGSAMDVLQQHVNAPVPMLPTPLAHYEPVLLKLMAKSREDRFTSADEILTALGPASEALPAGAAGDGEQVESSAA